MALVQSLKAHRVEKSRFQGGVVDPHRVHPASQVKPNIKYAKLCHIHLSTIFHTHGQ